MLIDIEAAKKELLESDNILIISHQKPDGDTLGAAFSLFWALLALEKNVAVRCHDGFPARYSFLCGGYEQDMSFRPDYIVAVDVASKALLGGLEDEFGDRIDLCVDHHKSNTLFAKKTLLDVKAPAACQLMYELLLRMGASIDNKTASALFTGISTDTGCFRYTSVTAKTHRIAAELIDLGADHAKINKLMFDTKSRGLIRVDGFLTEKVEFFFDDKCALVVLPSDLNTRYNVTEEELEGISAFPVRIDGVFAGITLRARENNTYRVSLRTVTPVDASKICCRFGGGGHFNAAGCTMTGELSEVTEKLLAAIKEELDEKVL